MCRTEVNISTCGSGSEHFHFLQRGCRTRLGMLPIPIAPTISLYHTKSSPTIFVPCVLEMLPRLKETEINRGKRLIGICRRSHSSEQFHEHLLFIDTLTMVVTLLSPGHEKSATGCQWHIDCGFWWKERASCNFYFYRYTRADSSTDSYRLWTRGSVLCWG